MTLLFTVCFSSFGYLIPLTAPTEVIGTIQNQKGNRIKTAATTVLQPDVPEAQYYGSSGKHYNYSIDCNLGQVYTAWVFPDAYNDDFDLNLYADDANSIQLESSEEGPGEIDLIVWNASALSMNLSVFTYTGVGDAVIEVDANATLTVNDSHQVTLDGLNQVETFTIARGGPAICNVTLQNPSTADFDLYVFDLASVSSKSFSEYTLRAISSGVDRDEYLHFPLNESGNYVFVVVRQSGSGVANLTIRVDPVPALLVGSNLNGFLSSNIQDCYQSNVDPGHYLVWVETEQLWAALELSISSPDIESEPTSIISSSGDVNFLLTSPASPTQYFIKTSKLESKLTGGYRIGMQAAESVDFGDVKDLEFSNECPIRFFSFVAEPGNSFDIELHHDSSAEYELYIFALSNEGIQGIGDQIEEGVVVTNALQNIQELEVYSNTPLGVVVIWQSGGMNAQFSLDPLRSDSNSGDLDFGILFGIIGIVICVTFAGLGILVTKSRSKKPQTGPSKALLDAKKARTTRSAPPRKYDFTPLESTALTLLKKLRSNQQEQPPLGNPTRRGQPSVIHRKQSEIPILDRRKPSHESRHKKKSRSIIPRIETRKPAIQPDETASSELSKKFPDPLPSDIFWDKSEDTTSGEFILPSPLEFKSTPMGTNNFTLPQLEFMDYEEFLQLHRYSPEMSLYSQSRHLELGEFSPPPSEHNRFLYDLHSLEVLDQNHLRVPTRDTTDLSTLERIFYDPAELSGDVPDVIRSNILQLRINICLNFNFLLNALQLMEVLDPLVKDMKDPFLQDALQERLQKVREWFEQGRFIPSHKIHTVLF